MKAPSIGTPIRTVALTVLFGFGVITGVAVGASAAPGNPSPCTTVVRGQQAASAVAPTPAWSPPISPRIAGPTP